MNAAPTPPADNPQPWHCPDCRVENVASYEVCWLCGTAPDGTPPPTCDGDGGPTMPPAGNSSSYSLGSLMLIMTLISVCLGVTVILPGLGIVLVLFAVPALIRTSSIAARHRPRGGPTGLNKKIEWFLASLCIMVVLAVATCAAFATVCFVSGLTAAVVSEAFGVNDVPLVLILSLTFLGGLGAALATLIYLGRELLPFRKRAYISSRLKR